MHIEVENDSIYYLTQSESNERCERGLVTLYEMEDNVKIYNLMKRGFYEEAQTIARDSNFPKDI